MLFADVKGSMDLAEQAGPEEWLDETRRQIVGALGVFLATSPSSITNGRWTRTLCQ